MAAITENGESPFFDFFSKLTEMYNTEELATNSKELQNFQKLDYYFRRLVETGPWYNETQIKPLEDDFFELKIKSTGLRVPFYYDEKNRSVVICTHHFEKKQKKTPKEEIARMKDIKRSFEKRRQRK